MGLVDELADQVGIIREGSLVREGTIAELKEVFKSYIYQFRIRGSHKVNPKMKKKYQASIISINKEFTDIELDCHDNAGVYRAISDFKHEKREILSMHRVVEDLEEVFLRVLNE